MRKFLNYRSMGFQHYIIEEYLLICLTCISRILNAQNDCIEMLSYTIAQLYGGHYGKRRLNFTLARFSVLTSDK